MLTPGPTTKRRSLVFSFGRGHAQERHQYFGSLPSQNYTTKDESFYSWPPKVGGQVTVSEGHPFASRGKGSKADIGGNFFTQKQYVKDFRSNTHMQWSETRSTSPTSGYTDTWIQDGPVAPLNPSTITFPPASNSSNMELDKYGATAVARCKPTNSVADVATFLGETLRDGLPHLVGSSIWKARTLTFKNSGNEYLNAEFGWRPFLSDIRNFAKAVTHANAVLAQYERDAGKQVRRRYNFPTVRKKETTTVLSQVKAYCPPSGMMGADSLSLYGDVIRTRETVQKRWFAGAFVYHLPTGSDSRSRMFRQALLANKLFGTNLSPETLWNLAPWSWAVDWFSNTGDVISNISDSITDGLVMRYGYIMEHTIVTDTYTMTKSGLKASGTVVPPLILVTETKVRRRANPFGFGVVWSGLSPRQIAISVALGLTRS